jgi:hypothetical protein
MVSRDPGEIVPEARLRRLRDELGALFGAENDVVDRANVAV